VYWCRNLASVLFTSSCVPLVATKPRLPDQEHSQPCAPWHAQALRSEG
jgi:hypothetical protein